MNEIKTWQERTKADGWRRKKGTYMQREIADLRERIDALCTALYVRDVEIDRISISAQQNADAAVEAEDKLEIHRAAALKGMK